NKKASSVSKPVLKNGGEERDASYGNGRPVQSLSIDRCLAVRNRCLIASFVSNAPMGKSHHRLSSFCSQIINKFSTVKPSRRATAARPPRAPDRGRKYAPPCGKRAAPWCDRDRRNKRRFRPATGASTAGLDTC